MSSKYTHPLFKISLLSLAVTSVMVQAQDAPTVDEEEIVVTGYRGALQNSTEAKRNSLGFTDEVFADDIGKMPSQNLAESLSRIPGVRINRDVDGAGQQISVRGLGPNFTKVALNGNSMSVASTGSLDAGNRNREVDLDMFPTELFSSLSVDKTSKSRHLEGGVSGYVNMRTLRPSDLDEGHTIKFAAEGGYNETASALNPKIAATYAYNGDSFGALISLVSKSNESRQDGYEHDSPFVDGCSKAVGVVCAGGDNAFDYTDIASADYVATHSGVTLGSTLDLLATSGLTAAQLDSFTMPRIARIMTKSGTKDSFSGLMSLEFSALDSLNFSFDVMHSEADNEFERTEAMLIYRNSRLANDLATIPENIVIENVSDGTNSQNRIVSGTFYSARPFVGTRLNIEELSFTSYMPSVSWKATDTFAVDLSYSKTESDFERDEPYVLYYGPEGTVDFSYDSGSKVPQLGFSRDLSVPTGGWTLAATAGNPDLRFARGFRDTETEGVHLDFKLGEDPERNGILFGFSSDEVSSNMDGLSGSTFRTYATTNAPDMVTNWESYMTAAPYNNIGTEVDGYKGVSGIAVIDWAKYKSAIRYDEYAPTPAASDQFAGIVGDIAEKTTAVYIEANTESEVAGRTLRTNSGVRLVDTDQDVATLTGTAEAEYSRLLPSFSMVYDITDDIKARASASRGLTRANPSQMLPSTAWSGNTIDSVRSGNPQLSPFESTNFDFGGEWYFSEFGYVGVNYYEKDLSGFPVDRQSSMKFADLTTLGINTSNLSAEQQNQLTACGGPTSCNVGVTKPVNIEGTVTLSGTEVTWVQPLDFVVEGLGFNASANQIDQEATNGQVLPGISDSLSMTVFYENESFQTRVTYYHQDSSDTGTRLWGRALNGVYNYDRTQIDLSASYNLPFFTDNNLVLTFDAYNLTNEPVATYVNDTSRTYRAYYPGATYTFGISGKF